MFYEEVRIKQGLSNISFSPLRILYNSKFIIMATSFGSNAVVLMRGHCTINFQRQQGNEWLPWTTETRKGRDRKTIRYVLVFSLLQSVHLVSVTTVIIQNVLTHLLFTILVINFEYLRYF